MHYIELALAGIWPFVWHWGTEIGLIILLVAAAYFSAAIPVIGPFLAGLRKELYMVAGAIAVLMAGQVIGAHDANNRCKAKQTVIEKIVVKEVAKTKTPAAVHQDDPFDSKDN